MKVQEKNRLTLLHLFLIEGVGVATLLKLVKKFCAQKNLELTEVQRLSEELSFFDLYAATSSDFVYQFGLQEQSALLIVEGLKNRSLLDAELVLIEKHEVRLITFFDEEYPALLRNIAMPPMVLYAQGAVLKQAVKRIAFVGSRQADEYAQTVINQLIPPLIAHEWEIVSGGAAGADTMAHQVTIRGYGKTIVVLGSGLLQLYPSSNLKLFRTIVEMGGTLLSSFALRTPPEKHNFPVRNRIIAGMSLGCVVIQAAAKSGALITAEYALEEGRQLFAIPGLVHHPLSKGCHELIAHGAKLVNEARDIFEEFGEHVTNAQAITVSEKKVLMQKSIVQQHSATKTKVEPAHVLNPQDPHYALLMMLDSVSSLDELSHSTGLSLAELHDLLFQLQLEGKVRQSFTGAWERVV